MESRCRAVLSAAWALAIAVFLAAMLGNAPAFAQQAPAQPVPPPAKVQQLLDLLADPEVKAWLETKAPPASGAGMPMSNRLDEWQEAVRNRIAALKAAIPRLPGEFAQAGEVAMDDMHTGRGSVLLIVLVLIGVGYGAEYVFRRLLARGGDPQATIAEGRHAHALQLLTELVPLAVFSVASVGLFILFDWPPFLKRAVLTYLSAFIAFRFVGLLSWHMLMPHRSGEPAADLSEADARFWQRRISIFAGIFFFGWAVTSLMPLLRFSDEAQSLIAYAFGLGLLGTAIEVVWRHPRAGTPRHPVRDWLLTVYLVLLWLVWVAGMIGVLWLGIYALVLPSLLSRVGRLAQTLAGTAGARGAWGVVLHSMVGRGARAVVILAALGWLALVVRSSGMFADRVVIANAVDITIRAIGVLLVADIVWNLAKAYIDHRLQVSDRPGANDEEKARSQRLRTLLPIFRNSLAVFIVVVAALTILSGMGVQIGPLIAGAGIFGVAIGFGSQTLVRDVISGVFYMLDDAFRVGEYIQSGSYMGTVEGFSLRSVRLRHHRGPVYTVPFGDLGAVQNMSRDWAIEKLTVNVTYDSDVDLAKKIIKQIGQDLAKDPEFAPIIIEPLKMQGVDSFGEFAVALKLKMVTKPGQQYVMKRRALLMIKKAFDENGIKIATPTVQVSSGGDAAAAAAQATVRRRKAAATQKKAPA